MTHVALCVIHDVFVSDYVNISKYCAMEVQLLAMKISCFVSCVAKLIISTVCLVADMLFSMS